MANSEIQFFGASSAEPVYLKNAGDTKIRRHIKIKSAATPFDPLYKEYFEQREQKRKWYKTIVTFRANLDKSSRYN